MSNLLKDNKELMNEFNFEKNSNIVIDKLTSGSGKKVWWKCSKGHEWQAEVHSRLKNGCPFCSGKKVIEGINDFATIHFELLKEWDYEKNNKLGIFPNKVLSGSAKKVWWICSKGHEYYSEIRSRAVYGYGCKYCAGHAMVKGENDLASANPNLLKEWDYKKNKMLPSEYSSSSNEKVWWICNKGHEWMASISNRNHKTNPTNCPYCANSKLLVGYNDLATKSKELASEWNYEKNVGLPIDYLFSSNKKVWWKCGKGHEWCGKINSRYKGSKCPICTSKKVLLGYNDLATTNPNLVKEWNYEKNQLKPTDFSKGSNYKVWWKCCKGHEWQATINSRTSGNGCPECSSGMHTSFPEQAIYYYIRKVYPLSENRFLLNNLVEYDIFIPDKKILIEYDGQYYHQKLKKKTKKIDKYEYAILHGYKFYRIIESDKYIKTSYFDNNHTFYYNYDKSVHLTELINNIFNNLNIKKDFVINVDVDFAKIESLISSTVEGNLIQVFPKILEMWDYEKNKNISLNNYMSQSGKKIWVNCSKGHSYLSRICDVVNERKCPYCINKKLLIGYNDLKTKYPELSEEWDYEKNEISPENVINTSSKEYFWICSNGHSYHKKIYNKLKHPNCPYCCNQRVLVGYNDFASKYPNLVKEWNYKKNNNLKPTDFVYGSSKVVWWKCSKCQNEWQSPIYKRSNGSSCPKCEKESYK